ncbi:MAG TPA: DUF1579 domain-containing protein [Planctomycetaceae bacterium]|jgi:hypothetical protein|nr:DUF1579 domain-containing protein [Planctomycetaceae bacterium]
MLRTILFAAAFCLTSTGDALAQAPQQPGPEHDKLKEVVGEWDTEMVFGDQKSKGTTVYRSICDGMWIESDFQGNVAGQKFQGRGLDGYDLTRKKYVGTWVDSMSSAPMHFEGNYEGKVLVMTGESIGPDGKPQKFKTTTEDKDKDHFTFKMFMVANGQEQLAFTINYTRRK